MPRYEIYYARRPTYVASGRLGTPLLTVARLQHTHVHLGTIEAENRSEAWRWMQGENWSPNGEARPLIEMLDLTHTSMSVGDVLREEDGTYWECLDLGWRQLEEGAEEEGSEGPYAIDLPVGTKIRIPLRAIARGNAPDIQIDGVIAGPLGLAHFELLDATILVPPIPVEVIEEVPSSEKGEGR